MATRNENLDRIRNAMGSYSQGTKNTTQMNGPRYETPSREENLRRIQDALGGNTAATNDTSQTVQDNASQQSTGSRSRDESLRIIQNAMGGGSTAAATPQSAPPTAPLTQGSLAGTVRSAEQVQQENPLTAADYDKLIREKETRLAELENEWRYKNNYTYEEKQAYLKEKNDIEEQIEALEDSLTAPNTNAERESLIRRMNEITANEGYATTVELADALTQEQQEIRQRLHQLDEELGNAPQFYDSGERALAVAKGAVKQTGAAYTNFMGTLQGLGNRLHEASSAADQAVAGSDYAGWATDELTAANMAEAIMKRNPDGNYLEWLQNEEQRLYEKADAIAESAAKDIEQAKEGLGGLGKLGVDISVNMIQNGIDAAGKAAGLGMLPFFVRAAGSASMEARHEGASTWQQVFYSVPKAAIEVATELISGGIAGTGVSGLDKVVEPLIGKLAKSTAGKIALNAIYDAAMEGTEEVISDLLDPFVKLVYNDQALKEAWENRADFGAQMLYDYLIGAVVGSIGTGTKIVTGIGTGQNAKLGGAEMQEQTAEVQTGQEQTAEATPQSAVPADSSPYTGEPTTPQSVAAERATTRVAPTAPTREAVEGAPANVQHETQAQAAETAQNAQKSAPNAETPPAAQNAAQTASGELNTQAEMEAREEGTGVQRDAMPTEGADTVRGFSENVATDSAMETALREDIAKNPDLYKRLSNKDTLKKAQDIFSQGIDTARSELERAIGAAQSGQKLAPEMVPLSRMVANELTRRGELDAARKIISDVAAELTSAGQLGQAGAILRNADPMTVLNTLQKAIDQINAEMAKKFGKRNPWTAELTAEEIKQISETDFSQDGAFEAVQQQIAERLGREMPATLWEKLREIRKVGMLANPKTQIKNVAGNMPLAGERKIAERLSGGLQELAVKAGIMSKEEQTRTLRISKESKDLAKSVYENNIDRINRNGNKGELRGILKDTRTYFNKGLLQKGIEKATGHQLDDAALDYVRRFTYDCLEKGDAPFVKSAFIDSLAQYCEAQGIKAEADVTDTAISYAIDQAMAATFKDASAFAKLLNSIKDNAGIAGQALDVLLPFTTTPINIAKEFSKYSPLGYLYLLNTKGNGAAEVIDIISRATTGSAVVALGAILRSLGFITGAADDDKDKAAADKAAGISPYSFGGKYSYEWMQPTGSALAMGASIYDAAKDGGSLIETISNGIISAGDAYLEQSFYKDIIDLFQGYGSPTENMIRELLTGTASQFIPTIAGAAARTIDPTVRTSYSGGNIIDDILAQAKVKTPGLSMTAPASVNVKGEEIQRGNLAERILDNFILPWTTNRNGGDKNAVDEAINEVYADTADKTIFRQVSPYKVDYGGETYKMTGEEREQFQKTQGQVHDDILQQIIDGTLWQEMDNDAKVKTMQLANQYALDAAKRELVESRGDEYSSDWDDEAELPDVGNYLAAKTTLQAAQDSKDYTLLDALIDNVTEQDKDVQGKLNKDFSMLDDLIYGQENGVDAKTIYVAKGNADANGNGSVTQEEMWNYLGLQKTMPTRTKSVLWDILTSGKTGYAEYAEKHK